jgi:hypothetical protein
MKHLNASIRSKMKFPFLTYLVLTLAALVPAARATDSGGILPNANTADGAGVLTTLGTGARNSGFGFDALLHDSIGNDNTATGNTALNQNQSGSFNTADGSTALFNNFNGSFNTASGYQALEENFGGSYNTATGYQALQNSDGSYNTATGWAGLLSNVAGIANTADGALALLNNDGDINTAVGALALVSNTTGSYNNALGLEALLSNTTGSYNLALGYLAGSALTTGDNNIDIGNSGVAAEAGTIRIGTDGTQTAAYIAGVWQQPLLGDTAPVLIDSSGQLGTAVGSSLRFKNEIKSMGDVSDAILSLRPVTFHYKTDTKGTPQFGLIAEEVAKVHPALVLRDKEGKPYTVRYDAVNAMLLNEFLKEHRKVEEQSSEIAQLKSDLNGQRKSFEAKTARQDNAIAVLSSQLQQVSAQLSATKTMTRIAADQ